MSHLLHYSMKLDGVVETRAMNSKVLCYQQIILDKGAVDKLFFLCLAAFCLTMHNGLEP